MSLVLCKSNFHAKEFKVFLNQSTLNNHLNTEIIIKRDIT